MDLNKNISERGIINMINNYVNYKELKLLNKYDGFDDIKLYEENSFTLIFLLENKDKINWELFNEYMISDDYITKLCKEVEEKYECEHGGYNELQYLFNRCFCLNCNKVYDENEIDSGYCEICDESSECEMSDFCSACNVGIQYCSCHEDNFCEDCDEFIIECRC